MRIGFTYKLNIIYIRGWYKLGVIILCVVCLVVISRRGALRSSPSIPLWSLTKVYNIKWYKIYL